MNPLAHTVMGLPKVILRLESVYNFTRILNFNHWREAQKSHAAQA